MAEKQRVIVLAVDVQSGETPDIIQWSMENIIRKGTDRIELVSGWSVESEMDAIELGGEFLYVGEQLAEMEKETEETLLQRLTECAKPLCDAGIDCHVSLVKGHRSPGNMIVDFTERVGAAMLILGSRGLSYWKRLFMGSFSDFCSHSAKCPVLVVKHESIERMHNVANTAGASLPSKTGLMADMEEQEQMPEPSLQDNAPSDRTNISTTATSTSPRQRRSSRLANVMDAL
ncbi:hypothetical protein BDF22DRAFT_733925 [Syncephalis plumigaleata]|nr:hypothetical protein BDF22DRAFT_733925 [Syncephalis plumigaleata]